MTSLLTCTGTGICQAGSSCQRPSCFQALLYAEPGASRPPVRKNIETCVSHLPDALQAVASWAHQQALTDGSISVVALDPHSPSPGEPDSGVRATDVTGLLFSTVPLSPHGG